MIIQNIVYNVIIFDNKSINLDEPVCKDITLDFKAGMGILLLSL